MKSRNRQLISTIIAAALVCALIMPVLPAAPSSASGSVVVYFRVEGPADEATFAETGEYQLIWAGNVTVPTDVYITTVTGNTWHLYVNESDRYIAECTAGSRQGESHDRCAADYIIGATSVLAALEQASQQGVFAYEVSDSWFPGMGFFIISIGGYTGSGAVGWNYRVWNPFDAYMPDFATDMFLLGYSSMPLSLPHEQVLFYWGGSGCYPLQVTSNKAAVGVGEEFTATVKYYHDQGWTGIGDWEPAAEATIKVGIETFTTGSNGQASIYLDANGNYELTATKGFDSSKFYINTDDRTVVSVSGGDTSSWWTQTTQGDFAAGTLYQVDTSVSPGDAKLERGGTVTGDYILDGSTATLGGEHFYDQFKIINGATLNVSQGEILRVHANYIEVDATSTINADGRGYTGGTGTTGQGNDGFGMGAGSGGMHSGSYGGGGGGAGHNKDGGAGSYGMIAEAEGGTGGRKYGAICRAGDDTFYMGSGGGGGAGSGTASGGNSGNGGGAVVLECMYTGTNTNVVINGTITANGDAGSNGAGAGCGGGGGGSGGTILIKGKNISIADGVLSVAAGDGGDKGGAGGGGGGGGTGGHIKVFFESCNDSSGHYTSRGYGGVGDPNDGSRGYSGSGSRKSYWYDYTAQDPPETYSPILPFHDSGILTSSAYDTGYAADFGKIRWCDTIPTGTEVKFQIATNNDNATWNFKGPDGTDTTYYETSGTDINSGHNGDRYVKYKAFFISTQVGKTPTLSKVGITFTEVAGEVISFTVTDYNNDGIKFGSIDPGQADQPADWGGSQGAVTLAVGAETNVNVGVYLKGNNFTVGGSTLLVTNVKYDDDPNLGEGAETGDPQGAMATSYGMSPWYTVAASTADTHQVYHWISIPGGRSAGAYTSTFYYQAIKSP